MSKLKTAGLLLGALALGFFSAKLMKSAPKNDIRAASVMIMNRSMNHGGTGSVIQSSSSQSTILTNDHVCRAVKSGGVVKNKHGVYQIEYMIESQVSDLCLVVVRDNLHINLKISDSAPKMYDHALVSGHPALMPNVISEGHFSGRQIIEVMTGIRPCTDEELKSEIGIVCMFLGGIPIVKSYESVLVTATIMPGSSGSAIYNSDMELAGVVFAGSQGFGYAWTVPYEQVLNFLYDEHTKLPKYVISQEIDLFKKEDESKRMKAAWVKCDSKNELDKITNTKAIELINNWCAILKKDVTWRK